LKFPIADLKAEIQGHGLISLARDKFIPSGVRLAKLAWKRVSFANKELNPREVKNKFNDYLCELVGTEYAIYLEHEAKCINDGVWEIALDPKSVTDFPVVRQLVETVLGILEDKSIESTRKLSKLVARLRPFYKLVEQSFAQGRMSRAGGSSQYHLQRLFEIAGYQKEFETQQVLNGTVDFVFPSLKAWRSDRRKCLLVSVKRSLRERYKQVFEELGIAKGLTVFLLVTETYKEAVKDITESKVKKLDEQNIYLVLRDEIKKKRFSKAKNVISFSEFIQQELPNRRAQWRSLI
jgi:hypothetical protein